MTDDRHICFLERARWFSIVNGRTIIRLKIRICFKFISFKSHLLWFTLSYSIRLSIWDAVRFVPPTVRPWVRFKLRFETSRKTDVFSYPLVRNFLCRRFETTLLVFIRPTWTPSKTIVLLKKKYPETNRFKW